MRASILVLLPRLTHPFLLRRISQLQLAGYQVEIMAFKRDFHHGGRTSCPVTSLGVIRHENYLRRIPTLIGALPKIRAGIRRSQLVYAYNADLALTAFIAGLGLRRPIILDVLDILAIQVAPGLKGRLARAIDKAIVERCRLLVLISSGYRHYYRDWLNANTPDIVITEKIEFSRVVAEREDESPAALGVPFLDRPLRIGYFAVLRDPWSLELLECLTRQSNRRFEVCLAGAVSPKIQDFDRFLESNPGIEYRGQFQHPDDLPALYKSVDMILACKPPVVPDCWAQTSRYYEACFFQKPLIVRAGTGDARQVERHQVGLIIRENSPGQAVKQVDAISSDDWLRWRTNMAALPPDIYSHVSKTDGLLDLDSALNNLLQR